MNENKKKNNTPNFSLSEFTCKCGCNLNNISPLIPQMLQFTRDLLKRPIIITCGTRCPDHNRKVGGHSNSSHLRGYAVDIKTTSSYHRYFLILSLYLAGFRRIEIARNHVHVDIDPDKPQNVLWLGNDKKRNNNSLTYKLGDVVRNNTTTS